MKTFTHAHTHIHTHARTHTHTYTRTHARRHAAVVPRWRKYSIFCRCDMTHGGLCFLSRQIHVWSDMSAVFHFSLGAPQRHRRHAGPGAAAAGRCGRPAGTPPPGPPGSPPGCSCDPREWSVLGQEGKVTCCSQSLPCHVGCHGEGLSFFWL